MRIITPGVIERDRYKATCPVCNCYFKYSADDIVWSGNESIQNTEEAQVVCPECNHRMPAIAFNIERPLVRQKE